MMPQLDYVDHNTGQLYLGSSLSNRETTQFVLYDLPKGSIGLYSLGQLQHMQVSNIFDEANYAIGNSYANPAINLDSEVLYRPGKANVSSEPNRIRNETDDGYVGNLDHSVIDISYLLNHSLWDQYFFSTTEALNGTWLADRTPLPNSRYIPSESISLAELQDYKNTASHLMVDGAFNVNSTSITAWKAILSTLNGSNVDPNNPANINDGNDLKNAILRMPKVPINTGTATESLQMMI